MSDENANLEEGDPDASDLAPRSTGGAQRFWNLVPVIGVVVCCYFLARSKDDVMFLFQSSTPVDLGAPGAYHLGGAANGVFAKIRGEVRSEGARFQHFGIDIASNGMDWPLKEAPVILERDSFNEMRGDVTAEGMLKIDDKLPPQYQPVIAAFHRRNQLGLPGPDVATAHTFVLVMGHTPHSFDRSNAWVVVLLLLFLLNAWWVVRPMVLRRG
jgi:hypothetical protein